MSFQNAPARTGCSPIDTCVTTIKLPAIIIGTFSLFSKCLTVKIQTVIVCIKTHFIDYQYQITNMARVVPDTAGRFSGFLIIVRIMPRILLKNHVWLIKILRWFLTSVNYTCPHLLNMLRLCSFPVSWKSCRPCTSKAQPAVQESGRCPFQSLVRISCISKGVWCCVATQTGTNFPFRFP